jgi:ribosomal protein S18 acetylase RimI-like enzyme
MDSLVFKNNSATYNDILLHLKCCNNQFVPPLNSRISLEEYSLKIFEKAIKFEIWNKRKLIGLLAVYKNDESKSLFITNVSVEENFTGNGFSNKLLEKVIAFCENFELKNIKLEVNKNNTKAISLYNKFNFIVENENPDSIILNYTVKIKDGK